MFYASVKLLDILNCNFCFTAIIIFNMLKLLQTEFIKNQKNKESLIYGSYTVYSIANM